VKILSRRSSYTRHVSAARPQQATSNRLTELRRCNWIWKRRGNRRGDCFFSFETTSSDRVRLIATEPFKIIFILNSRRIRIYNLVTRTTLKTPPSILIVSIKNALKIVQRESVYAIFSQRIKSDFVRINTYTPCLFLLSRKKKLIITWKTFTRIKRIFFNRNSFVTLQFAFYFNSRVFNTLRRFYHMRARSKNNASIAFE